MALFPNFAPAGATYRGYAHNCFLQLGAEVGLLGLGAFLVPVLAVAWREGAAGGVWRGPREALFWGLVAFLIQSAFDTNLYAFQAAHAFWIAWGALNAVPSSSRGERP